MKRLVLLMLVLTSTITANAQESKPTKEETINWVKEKLQTHLISTFRPKDSRIVHFKSLKVDNITECEITVTYTFGGLYGDGTYNKYIIPVDPNLLIDSNTFYFNQTDKIKVIDEKGRTSHTNNTNYFSLRNAEDDLIVRFKKAISHLATFCPKKQETF